MIELKLTNEEADRLKDVLHQLCLGPSYGDRRYRQV